MMGTSRKDVGNGLVHFVHQIVYYQERGLASVKIGNVWQTMSKDDVRVFAKQLLVFSVAVDYSGRWWVYHATDIVDEFEDGSESFHSPWDPLRAP